MINNPLVSIIIPVFNGSEYMREAIESALAQTYSNIEVIVVNDGSKDNGKTEKIALEYGEKIKYIYKENGGVSSALNIGIRYMTGEYFSWLSHDDVYVPDKIEKQIEVIKKNNLQNAVVKSFTNFIDKDSKLMNYKVPKTCERVWEWDDAVQYVTKFGVNGCTLLIPKKVFEQVGGFDERLRYCQDTFMWWKIFLQGYSMVMCDHVGVYSRIHEKQLTRTGSALFHHDSKLISESIIPEFVRKSTKTQNLLYEYAKKESIHGNKEVVKKCIQVGIQKKIISKKEMIALMGFNIYGYVRPMIRMLYYKVIHGIRVR